jgi:hypothetical protein
MQNLPISKTFAGAQRNMIGYLKSSEFSSRGDTAGTVKHLDHLLEINRLGLLTITSQIGIQRKEKDAKTGKD